jgi:hypothetical protein
MIKDIFNTIITHQNDENKIFRYFNKISRYEQATTSAIAAAQTLDPGERFRVLAYAITRSQRHVIVITNL